MKINLLYLKTGGGHLSAAQSIADELKEAYGGKVKSIMIDCLDESPKFFKKLIEEGYHFSTSQIPILWPIIYGMSSIAPILAIETSTFSLMVKKNLKKKILEEKPDKIIVLHHLLTKPTLQILQEEKLKIPVLIIATDPFTPPRIWFNQKKSKFVVFSEKAKKIALKRGISPKNISIFPTIINKKYYQKIPENLIPQFKEKYGFTPNKKLIVMTGGGTGLPKGCNFLKQLLDENIDAEYAVVCGKNSAFQKKCEKLKKLYPHKKIQIYSFVDFMYELINMADVVVTKGGPASVLECIMLEKPPVIVSYIWRQEKGNVEFIVKNKVGFYETNPKKVVKKVKLLLEDKKTLESLKTNIQKVNIMKSNTDLSEFIYSFNQTIDQKILADMIKNWLKKATEIKKTYIKK